MNKDYFGWDYESFPHSQAMSRGIQRIYAKTDEPSCQVDIDVIYRVVDNTPLHLQIIYPDWIKKKDEKLPLIVYVQGSAWKKQALGKQVAQLSRFAQNGYIVAIVEYRHSAWASFPAQIIDTKYAIQFMICHKDIYSVDETKIILWGDSSGANTAMLAGLTQKDPFFLEEGLKEYPISCIIDFFGPTDLYQMSNEPSIEDHRGPDSPEGLVLGHVDVTEESADKIKVTNYIQKEKYVPPFLIFHGSKDRIVPFHQSVLLYDTLIQENKIVECYQIYGADHGGDSFWNREVLSIVDQFIKKQI